MESLHENDIKIFGLSPTAPLVNLKYRYWHYRKVAR